MIKVLINLSDRQFGGKLAMKLSETSDMLDIKTEGSGGYDFIIDDGTDEILPVSGLVDRILGSYMETTGKPFYGPERGLKKAFLFTSPEGGSGLSSVAFSFARTIAGKTGQKTLYTDIGPAGRFTAGEYTEKATGTVRELEYVIKNIGLIYPMKYLSRDHFGPFVLCMDKYAPDIIWNVAEAGGFTRIVIAGADGDFGYCDDIVRMAVINVKDVRSAGMDHNSGGYDYVIRNREYINTVSDNEISIADDSLSFKFMDGGVRISLSGEFGIGIEKLVKVAEDDGEEGVFWKMS